MRRESADADCTPQSDAAFMSEQLQALQLRPSATSDGAAAAAESQASPTANGGGSSQSAQHMQQSEGWQAKLQEAMAHERREAQLHDAGQTAQPNLDITEEGWLPS